MYSSCAKKYNRLVLIENLTWILKNHKRELTCHRMCNTCYYTCLVKERKGNNSRYCLRHIRLFSKVIKKMCCSLLLSVLLFGNILHFSLYPNSLSTFTNCYVLCNRLLYLDFHPLFPHTCQFSVYNNNA